MLRRSPDLILAAVTGILILRAALWVTTSARFAHVIVATLLPVWIVLELTLLAGTIACAYSLLRQRHVYLFGQPAERQITIPLILVGLVTLLLESALWLYGSGIV